MTQDYAALIDANLNRASEGLRVIEDYCRFEVSHDELTHRCAGFRYRLAKVSVSISYLDQVLARDSEADVRAKEIPSKRKDFFDLLIANVKRVTEALRVLEEYTQEPEFNSLRYDVYSFEKDLLLSLAKPKIKPGVYLISDSVETLQKGFEWGVSLVQLRDKSSSKADILVKAKELAQMAQSYETPFLINDFLDIALTVDADGLHTGQDDISVEHLRSLMGPHKLLGRTTHDLEQGLIAQDQGADYVSVGPLWETPSKPGRAGIGFDYLKDASTQLSVPYVAIGGVNISNVDEIIPFNPPMIGLIRDVDNIPVIQKKMA